MSKVVLLSLLLSFVASATEVISARLVSFSSASSVLVEKGCSITKQRKKLFGIFKRKAKKKKVDCYAAKLYDVETQRISGARGTKVIGDVLLFPVGLTREEVEDEIDRIQRYLAYDFLEGETLKKFQFRYADKVFSQDLLFKDGSEEQVYLGGITMSYEIETKRGYMTIKQTRTIGLN